MVTYVVPASIREILIRRRGRVRLFESIDRAKTAFLVVDMQNCFCAPETPFEVPAARSIVNNINYIADECRKADIPVFWVKHVNENDGSDWSFFYSTFLRSNARELVLAHLSRGTWGTELYKDLKVLESDHVLTKNRYSAFLPYPSAVEGRLRELNKNLIIIAGTKTNVCCESTARDAMMLDFGVIAVSDAMATTTEEEHIASLNTLVQSFADVLSTEEVVDLIRRSV